MFAQENQGIYRETTEEEEGKKKGEQGTVSGPLFPRFKGEVQYWI